MLSSIHPLGERARNNRWIVTIVAYTVAVVASGAAIGAALGWIGSLVSLSSQGRRWLFVGAALTAAVLDLARVKAWGPTRQVNERWIGHYRGWVYGVGFGAQLGVGIATYVVTWGVVASYVIEFSLGSVTGGAIVGAVFGAGRAVALLAASYIDRPSRLTAFHRRMATLGPPMRIMVGVTFAVAAVVGVVV